MLHRTLNLGILAHVDAGKTTLTERLLYAAGVIDELGSVDHGTTQTDSLALERRRGITIRSAVASFAIDDVTVNLIDTPGHPDFIAEVERVLGVLDGAVLVISAVEGVQPQTRILMRALQRLRVPTLIFVNKIDRPGANDERTLAGISDRLTPSIVRLGLAHDLGTPAADVAGLGVDEIATQAVLTEALAEHDDAILRAYLGDVPALSGHALRRALAVQIQRALVHPVFFGSARTGAGVEPLLAGIAELLPAAVGDADGPVSGTVFKIERGVTGEKIAYVRMFSGTVRIRDRVRFGATGEQKVADLYVFDRGPAVRRGLVSAGEIGKLWGLGEIRVGDPIGRVTAVASPRQFAPPTLESVVVPRNSADKGTLRIALAQLAEQDPLIDVRQDSSREEIRVSLYGEIQKEVIQTTLATDFGVEVTFRETTVICVERPAGSGEAIETLYSASNPFLATIGLRVDPGPIGTGVEFRLRVDIRSVPLYVYKTTESFRELMAEYVGRTLQGGLRRQVTDCVVTMNACGYTSPGSTAADFRKLTPLVLGRALERAGSTVCEPMLRVTLEVPADAATAVLPALARLGGVVRGSSYRGELLTIETALPAGREQDLRRQLPGLTSGEGVLESAFAGYEPVAESGPSARESSHGNRI